MKNLFRSLTLLTALAFASTAFAALNCYLNIAGGKNKSQIVDCSSGTCTVADLAPGEYTVTACSADGKPLDAATLATYDVKSPRDAASGLATGKRQHGEVKITKEWSASSPMLKVTISDQNAPLVLKATVNTTRSNIKK